MTTEDHGHDHDHEAEAKILDTLRGIHNAALESDLSCEFANALLHHMAETMAGLSTDSMIAMMKVIVESAQDARQQALDRAIDLLRRPSVGGEQ